MEPPNDPDELKALDEDEPIASSRWKKVKTPGGEGALQRASMIRPISPERVMSMEDGGSSLSRINPTPPGSAIANFKGRTRKNGITSRQSPFSSPFNSPYNSPTSSPIHSPRTAFDASTASSASTTANQNSKRIILEELEGNANGHIDNIRSTLRHRKASSGTRLNYLRSSGCLQSSIRGDDEIGVKLHYQKWTPFNPSNNVLILFNAFGHSNDNRSIFAIAKYFVPIGYLVYSFEYQYRDSSEEGHNASGHISSWRDLRQDVHKFLCFVLSPTAHVFLYGRSAGCLVILDFLLQQSYIQALVKGVIMSKPALSFLDSKKPEGVQQKLGRLLKAFAWRRGENTTPKFLSEFAKTSKFVLKNASKINVPLLVLQFDAPEPELLVDTGMNSKFYLQFKAIQLLEYDPNFRETTPLGIKQLLGDMEKWLKKYEAPTDGEDSFDGTNWSLLPQELKHMIFSYLDIHTIGKAASVCKAWCNLMFICVDEIDLNSDRQRNERYLLRYMTSFPFVKSLNLEGWGTITDIDMEYITEKCHSLQRLNLGGCWQVTDTSLALLAENCLNLRGLCLRSCPKVTNEGLKILASSCHLLESLNLSKCTQVTSEGLTELALQCPLIKELDLSYFKLGRIQTGLEMFTQLEILILEGRQLRTSDDIDNDDVNGHLEKLFEHLPHLRHLSLQGSAKVSPKVRENIALYCTRLEKVNLSHT